MEELAGASNRICVGAEIGVGVDRVDLVRCGVEKAGRRSSEAFVIIMSKVQLVETGNEVFEVYTVSVSSVEPVRGRGVVPAGIVTHATGATTVAAADGFVQDRRPVWREVPWYLQIVGRSVVRRHRGLDKVILWIQIALLG